MEPKTLSDIIKNHSLWFKTNGKEGKKANLRGAKLRGANLSDTDLRHADLRGADLRGADLRGADLRGADLSDADLCHADLSDADLCHTNLSHANLRGAKLRGADLYNCIGNNNQIKTIQTGVFTVNWTKDIIWIGCKAYTLDQWVNFEEGEIKEMDKEKDCISFANTWKDTLVTIFEKFNKN